SRGRAVNDGVDFGNANASVLAYLLNALDHADRLVLQSGRHLVVEDALRALQNKVRVRPPDIDADTSHRSFLPHFTLRLSRLRRASRVLFGRRALGVDRLQIVDALIDAVDVSELRVDVEEIPGDRPGNTVADAFPHGDGPEAISETVAERGANAGRRGHACHQNRIDPGGTQDAREFGSMEAARSFLQQRIFALDRSDAGIDCPQILVLHIDDLDWDLAVPEPH